jgi:alanine racemase
MRSTHALIDLSALRNNYLSIKRKTGQVKIMAVVKADAYGHGVEKIIETLNSLPDKPEYFAVAFPEEGEELRRLKVKQPILVFEPPYNSESAKIILKNKLTATVESVVQVNLLKKVFNELYKKPSHIPVHIKIDTGMNRLGIRFQDAINLIEKVSNERGVYLTGIYTHFATAGEKDKTFTLLQLKRFSEIINKLKEKKINYGLAHAANSGAIIDLPESYFDMVRPGISLYGYYPSLETTESVKLKPVLSLISSLGSTKRIEPGDSVSYGRKFIARKPSNIASVSIGYADGFWRNLSNKSYALINGKSYSQIGTVTMDRILLNLEDDKIKTGSKVILIGKSKREKITAWDWGKTLNTIPYEVTCGIGKRVPRIYRN